MPFIDRQSGEFARFLPNPTTLPYGYCCKDGVIVTEPQESKVLKRIYAAYLDGSSMLTIAEQLNREKIEYRDGVTGWNKGRLKHLIDNTKYLGTEVYPSIIDQETYEKIQKTKHGRNTQRNTDKAQDIFRLTVPVRCPSCGDRMRRRHDSRCKCQERWTCENTACRLRIEISDTELLTALADLLGTVTADSITLPAKTPYEPSAEVIRLNNEISRMLDMAEIDKAVFLAGDSLKGIAKLLEEKGIKSPTGKAEWQFSTIQSILSNERYKGDAIINKTYITDCISKKVRVNNGERPKYYVENSHPAIIDSSTFGRVQEELARRSGKRKISRKAKTEQGKYSSKYALTELLVCGECKSAYRRCTWTASGKKKIVWRCINRIEYAKKYCHNSPSVEESVLQRAVMAAIMKTAARNTEVLQTLKLHIGMGLAGEKSEDNSIDLQIRIAELDAEFKKMLDRVSTDTIEAFDEETATRLMNEKSRLQQQLDSIADAEQRRENAKSRLDDIYTILDGIKNRPMEYDDQIVRQLLECVVVDSKEQITVIFKGGLKSVQPLNE